MSAKKTAARTDAETATREVGERAAALVEKSYEESMELGVRIQDEALNALERQVEMLQDGMKFALENQKHLLAMTRSNLEGSRQLWKDGAEAWAAQAKDALRAN